MLSGTLWYSNPYPKSQPQCPSDEMLIARSVVWIPIRDPQIGIFDFPVVIRSAFRGSQSEQVPCYCFQELVMPSTDYVKNPKRK
jgi:hypothetical protein